MHTKTHGTLNSVDLLIWLFQTSIWFKVLRACTCVWKTRKWKTAFTHGKLEIIIILLQ